MRWLFWKKAPEPPRPPYIYDIERPHGSLGGPWAPEAPDERPEADMAELERENREHHERARSNRSVVGVPQLAATRAGNRAMRLASVDSDRS